MNTNKSREIILEKIDRLSTFKKNICRWYDGHYHLSEVEQLYSEVKQNTIPVREIVMETRCLKLISTIPSSLTGGMIIRDCDPFTNVLNSVSNISYIPEIVEMIDEAIAVLKSPRYLARLDTNRCQNN